MITKIPKLNIPTNQDTERRLGPRVMTIIYISKICTPVYIRYGINIKMEYISINSNSDLYAQLPHLIWEVIICKILYRHR